MANNNNTDKRIKSTIKYIDGLSETYSKLMTVRVDLAYKKPYSETITLEEANCDLSRMLNNTRSKPSIFEDKVGYICKREYTEDKGVHFHTIFLFDGQKTQKDVFKADQIGQYWENTITKGQGSYHNCNRNDYQHSGIGMIDHRDSEKRKILDEKVIPYLCKDEQTIDPLKNGNKDRAFTRGTITKSTEKRGRPRATLN